MREVGLQIISDKLCKPVDELLKSNQKEKIYQ